MNFGSLLQHLLAALAGLGSLVIGRLAQRDVCASTNGGLGTVAIVEGLARYNPVDLCIGAQGGQIKVRYV